MTKTLNELGSSEGEVCSGRRSEVRLTVDEAFRTWEGREVLDRLFGAGFGTNPGGTWEWRDARAEPTRAALRARDSAAIDDRRCEIEVERLELVLYPFLPPRHRGLRSYTVFDRRATPRQAMVYLRAQEDRRQDPARWQADYPRCCA